MMRIPSENFEDLVYPQRADVSFLTLCMMSLVLDDFFLSMSTEVSKSYVLHVLSIMDFVLHDSHGDVMSSCF